MRLLTIAFALLLPVAALGKAFPIQLDSAGRHEMEIELDAYYSAVDYIFGLTEQPIPKLSTSEQGVYSYLISNMVHPRFGLVEVSANPLPLVGVTTREFARDFYDSSTIGNVNVIQALTAGFPEPGAVSFFLGNVADFVDPSTGKESGKGYSGMLLSVGNYHIVQDRMVEDWWSEGEVKLKGTDIQKQRRLSWSFRAGSKVHRHPDIENSFYLSIARSRTDFDKGNGGWMDVLTRNSEVEWRTDMNYRFEFTRYFALVGKKWPSASGNWAWSLSLGVLRQLGTGYKGSLAEELDGEWGVVVRPNIVF